MDITLFTSAEATSFALTGAAAVVSAFASVACAGFNHFIKDKAAQERAVAFMKWAAPLALNKIDGLIAGHPLPAIQVPTAVGIMLSLAKPAEMEAFKRLGLDGDGLAKFAIAHLPGVEGEISDDDITAITAAVNAPPTKAAPGQPATKTATTADLEKALGPLLGRLMEIELQKRGFPAKA